MRHSWISWLLSGLRSGVNSAIEQLGDVVSGEAPWMTRKAPSTTEVLPPFGTNPPSRPIVEASSSLDGRLITNDPRELWYLALPTKLTPNQCSMILRSAQGGDLWQQFQLTQLMLDTWPMLKKCDHEIREAASCVRYVAKPACEEGEEPTPEAKERADLVNRCFKHMKPNGFNDERGFKGMVYHLAGAFLMGMVMEELLWDEKRTYSNFGTERRLRAAAFVHPRHFTFTDAGTLAVFDDNYNRLYFNMATIGQSPDRRKFVCGQFYSSSGSTLGAGFIRPLAWYWSSVIFNREWMAKMAQNYGSPFLDVTYKGGMSAPELAELDENIRQGLSNRFIRHKEGTTLEMSPAAALGEENPQRVLAEDADKQCQLLMLGQTLTSDTPDKGGSRAQGEVHMQVRQDRVEGVAKWLASDPLTQVARAICVVNFGDDEDCPTIEVDMSKPMTATEQAQYLNTISQCRVPLLAEETYAKIGMAMPEQGNKVLVNGELGILGSTEEEIAASTPPQPLVGLDGQPLAPTESENEEPEAVEAALARMDAAELDRFENLVRAAEQAPHPNGEWAAVKVTIKAAARKPNRVRRNPSIKSRIAT